MQSAGNHLHLYDQDIGLQIRKENEKVLWSRDELKCAVSTFGKTRVVIDLASKNRDVSGWKDVTLLA